MSTCVTLCEQCGSVIGGMENAHQFHGYDCDRALQDWCRCDGWLCAKCCPDQSCTPLASRLREAQAQDRARIEVAG